MKKFQILNITRRRKDGVKTCLSYIVFIFTLFEFNGFLLKNTFIFNKRFDTILKNLKKKDKMRWDRTDRKKRLMLSIYLQTQTLGFFFNLIFSRLPRWNWRSTGNFPLVLQITICEKKHQSFAVYFLKLNHKKILGSILHCNLFCYTLLFFKFQKSCGLKGHGHEYGKLLYLFLLFTTFKVCIFNNQMKFECQSLSKKQDTQLTFHCLINVSCFCLHASKIFLMLICLSFFKTLINSFHRLTHSRFSRIFPTTFKILTKALTLPIKIAVIKHCKH